MAVATQLQFDKKKNTIVFENYSTEPVRLTNEEKYAYNQLLLALSITSSKLKLVQETIDRMEDRKEISKENNR